MNRVARHIANFYGRAALSCLIEDLQNKVALPQIAKRMNVSRQRVHQWKGALGYETIAWEPHPDTIEVLNASTGTQGESQRAGG